MYVCSVVLMYVFSMFGSVCSVSLAVMCCKHFVQSSVDLLQCAAAAAEPAAVTSSRERGDSQAKQVNARPKSKEL